MYCKSKSLNAKGVWPQAEPWGSGVVVGGEGLLSEKLKQPLPWALKILIESSVLATPFFKRQAKIKPTVQFTGRSMYVNPVQRMAAYYQN